MQNKREAHRNGKAKLLCVLSQGCMLDSENRRSRFQKQPETFEGICTPRAKAHHIGACSPNPPAIKTPSNFDRCFNSKEKTGLAAQEVRNLRSQENASGCQTG